MYALQKGLAFQQSAIKSIFDNLHSVLYFNQC